MSKAKPQNPEPKDNPDDTGKKRKRRSNTTVTEKRKSKARVVVDSRLDMVFEIGECCKALPKYTLGQVLYSALRKISKKYNGNISFLLSVTDKELMMDIDNIIIEEKE